MLNRTGLPARGRSPAGCRIGVRHDEVLSHHVSPPLRGGRRDKRERRRSGWGYLGRAISRHQHQCRGLPPPLPPPHKGEGKSGPFQSKQPLAQNPHPFHPHLPPPCHTSSAPAAGWTLNVSDQAGGRPFGIWRNVRQVAEGGGGHRGSAGGRPDWPCKASHRAGTRFRKRCHGGRKRKLRSGPVADMTRKVPRQGPCRIPKTTPAVSPDRGRSNPGGVTPLECEAPPVGCGHHPAIFGPCAWLSPPIVLLLPEAKPACGPPDLNVIKPVGGFSRAGDLAWHQARSGCSHLFSQFPRHAGHRSGIQRDQLLDRERAIHGVDAPWLDPGSRPG